MTGAGGAGGSFSFVWMSRTGEATPIDSEWQFNPGDGNAGWSLSPDDSRLVLREITETGSDIWVKELPTGPRSRLTFDEATTASPAGRLTGNT